ncbi:hypothetical protein ERO13_A08G239200v2 [Gossypium hirsutum]|uniref:Uncharacterized protein isoform X1 n=2 Tax=Gossypium TaxID=3633 RepID=A0A1U8JPH5_GOSHI|nr:uncharacterized protein LOC107909220 isoform X1 [Gossypium hirsutum]KAG4189702.1 hypothetical protein ERO13_A08G239200v2 [Gossypium hirsutum]TYI16842.1 hypothetical protein ES332_A08G282100v1 [Gossypium tomentosum]
MSGGTPVGGGYIRQRHSQGYASSNEDLEDDACSRLQPFSPSIPRAKTWTEVLENVLWVASALFIIYFGDRHSNLIYLLLHDERIRRGKMQSNWASMVLLPQSAWKISYLDSLGCECRMRMPLYLGLVSTVFSVAIFFYMSILMWSVRRFDEKWELLSINALPFLTLLGLISFCLLCFALWPIWGFLTLPLLFTLFMAGLVVYPHIMIETLRQQNDSFRID